MARVRTNGIELEYEEHGEGEPLVLLMGLGAQLVLWPLGFVKELTARGFRVIAIDHRDTGLSTKLGGAAAPNLLLTGLRWLVGAPGRAAYTLSDMARDVTGLLDALGLPAAHMVGMSMGGMIAQTLAIEHPERVRTMVSWSSSPGSRRFIGRPRALLALLDVRQRTRAEAIERSVEVFRVIGSPGFTRDDDLLREIAARAYDRCAEPDGYQRQMAAILASGDRTAALARVRAPTLVIHGLDDPLLSPAGALATARAIPGARLMLVPGLGHDVPTGAWPLLATAIAENARRGAA